MKKDREEFIDSIAERHRAIKEIAQQIYERRMKDNIPGDALTDWNLAKLKYGFEKEEEWRRTHTCGTYY